MDLRERIVTYSHVEPNTGCWLWLGSVRTDGYGTVYVRRNGRPVNYAAHRASYTLWRGPIPDGLFVCHKCDTKLCVNPDHFFLGTAADNAADMVAKGRARSRFAGNHPTHCINGHEFTPENTRYARPRGCLSRVCRKCGNARAEITRKKRRARERQRAANHVSER